jgi:hypothetical protein
VLEESEDLIGWNPIQTNVLSGPLSELTIPFNPAANAFFRLQYRP